MYQENALLGSNRAPVPTVLSSLNGASSDVFYNVHTRLSSYTCFSTNAGERNQLSNRTLTSPNFHISRSRDTSDSRSIWLSYRDQQSLSFSIFSPNPSLQHPEFYWDVFPNSSADGPSFYVPLRLKFSGCFCEASIPPSNPRC